MKAEVLFDSGERLTVVSKEDDPRTVVETLGDFIVVFGRHYFKDYLITSVSILDDDEPTEEENKVIKDLKAEIEALQLQVQILKAAQRTTQPYIYPNSPWLPGTYPWITWGQGHISAASTDTYTINVSHQPGQNAEEIAKQVKRMLGEKEKDKKEDNDE